jgi:alpha-D-ribose 1-methylphosphonate 5-phosphate C-P lyase
VAKRKAKGRYGDLRPHAARIVKLAEYPMHVNGGYLDDPEHIPTFRAHPPKDR